MCRYHTAFSKIRFFYFGITLFATLVCTFLATKLVLRRDYFAPFHPSRVPAFMRAVYEAAAHGEYRCNKP